MKTHSLHEARAGFSRIVSKALSGEPQRVTRHGKEAVVVVAERDWLAKPKAAPTMGSFLAKYAQSHGVAKRDLQRPFAQKRRLGSDFD